MENQTPYIGRWKYLLVNAIGELRAAREGQGGRDAVLLVFLKSLYIR